MPISKSHYINTGKDGVLDATNEQDVDELFRALATAPKIVLHFHGGLVPEKSAMEMAERLDRDCYKPAGAHAVFFVWESGLIETLKHNITEIFGEDMFKILLKWVLKFAAGKLLEGAGGKSPALQTPSDMEVYTELAKNEQGREAFEDWTVPPALSEVTEEERAAFERTLEKDNDFQETVQAIVNSVVPQTTTSGEKGITLRTRRSARTLMSPDIVDELKNDAEAARAEGKKGIFKSAKLIKAAAEIFARVVRRFVQRRDHGLYPTVVEEIFRQFYIANIGTAVWSMMKRETAQTFEEVQTKPARGGWYFARSLSKLLATPHRPKITLVGHSTGAVFINNLLAHVHQMRDDPANPIPADFAFENVVLLAPACTFEHFVPTMTEHRAMFRNFRMFTMNDEAESRDALVKFVYTRSLLYFISGVLEPDGAGGVEFDKPLVGMERYYRSKDVYPLPEIEQARQFLAGIPQSTVWSPLSETPGAGLFSTSTSHGDFDNDENTLASMRHIIAN